MRREKVRAKERKMRRAIVHLVAFFFSLMRAVAKESSALGSMLLMVNGVGGDVDLPST